MLVTQISVGKRTVSVKAVSWKRFFFIFQYTLKQIRIRLRVICIFKDIWINISCKQIMKDLFERKFFVFHLLTFVASLFLVIFCLIYIVVFMWAVCIAFINSLVIFLEQYRSEMRHKFYPLRTFYCRKHV